VNNDIDREDILLLIFDAYARRLGRKVFNGATRLEKLIFLLSRDTPMANSFDFRAYKFGPYSKAVYEAADFLRQVNLVDVTDRPLYSHFLAEEEEQLALDTDAEQGLDAPNEEAPVTTGHERQFSLTPNGEKVANSLREQWSREHPKDLAALDNVVERFGSLPLNQLIRYVYKRYPDMAERSIHPEAERLGLR
jgi:uncharacterized protein